MMAKRFNRTIYSTRNGKTEKQLVCKSSSKDLVIPSGMILAGQQKVEESDEDDEDKPAKFYLLANTGVPMDLAGFFWPVVINIRGAKFDKSPTPVIYDHDTAQRIGHTTKQSKVLEGKTRKLGPDIVQGPAIVAEGIASSTSDIAQSYVQDSRRGFPFQVSVGSTILEASFIEEGEKVTVNGKTYTGPLIHAEKTLIREVTITVLGADKDTTARIAAHNSLRKDDAMNFEQWLEAMGFKLEDLNETQQNSLKAQYDRQQAGTPGLDIDTNTPEPGNVPTQQVTAQAPQQLPSFNPLIPNPLQASQSQVPGPAPNGGTQVTDPNQIVQTMMNSMNESMAANQARLDGINTLFAQHSGVQKVTHNGQEMTAADFKTLAITASMPTTEVELTLLKASYPQSGGPSAPAFHMVPQAEDLTEQAIACAMIRQTGLVPASQEQEWSGENYGWEHFYDDKTLEASDNPHIRGISLHQLFDMQIRAAGHSFHGNRRSDAFIKATRDAMLHLRANASASTTLEITNIFDDVANKMMLASYSAVNTTWQEIAHVQPVTDFKTHNMYRLISKGSYSVVGTDGQLTHGGFEDQKYQVSADTYGKIVGMDRKKLINDDMSAFSAIMNLLGDEGAKALEELVYVTWMTALATFYTAGKFNYISGADSDLDIDGLTKMFTQFSNQVDADNAPILVNPDRVLVGTQDRVIAGQLFSESAIRPVGSTDNDKFISNPHVGALRPIVTPYLNNTRLKQRVDVDNLGAAIPNQSSHQWFPFVNPNSPMGASINVALLNGNRIPVLESADAQFDMLGMRWRAYHDFGVGLGDGVLSAMSKGQA